jgi:small subunit ribosomal protein S3
MGQKIDPRGFRLQVTKDWSSRWFANNQSFASNLIEDIKIREFLMKKFGRRAAIGRVIIERPAKSIKVTMFTARPGVVIGKKGEGIEQIKKELQTMTTVPLHVNVEEIRKPELNAQIVGDQVAQQLEKRVAFRRAMKRSMQAAMKLGAQGIKIETSGRLNGIEIARSEWYREGRVPLHTIRADVEYATSEALTTYGIIGIKVWIYKGDMNVNKANLFKATKEEDKTNRKPGARKPAPRKRKRCYRLIA